MPTIRIPKLTQRATNQDLARGLLAISDVAHQLALLRARAFGGEANIRFGGGTALAARWAHRHSVGVDLFVEPEGGANLLRGP